jgi:putative flippase GtrA
MTLTILVSGLGASPRVASIPALVLGALVQFVGNKRFAFRDRSPDWAGQSLQFAGVEMLGFAANAIIFDLLVAHTAVPYLVARCLGSFFVYVAICMPLWTRIFTPAEES